MQYPSIPLKVQNDIERLKSWEGVSTPHELALYMARILSVDATNILELQEVVYSDVQPTGTDSKKIWVKTDPPQAVGLPTSEGYKMLYEYPANIPFLWIEGVATLPSYIRILTTEELTDYSLTNPANNLSKWVIYSTQ